MTTSATLEPATGSPGLDSAAAIAVVADDAGRAERVTRLLAKASLEPFAGSDAATADAVVIALESIGREGILAIRRLRERVPGTPILVVATPARDHDIRLAVKAGAHGVVLDDDAPHALVAALRAVLAGQISLPVRARREAVRAAISHREKEILALMLTGATNRQIGDSLFLTESTVKSHLASAFAKLGVRSRAEAATVLEEDALLSGLTAARGVT